ncbi:MAG TPA: hypothetical protein VF268_06890, partial [Gammaproteobacteria bacterium]
MIDPFQSLGSSAVIFVLAALVIVAAGARMSAVADRLADRTGWGEAVFGAIFLAIPRGRHLIARFRRYP